jgi:predicted transglutaminase-like cysteine proteinase
MSLKIIDEVFDIVRRRISYESDEKVFGKVEYWKSWKKEIAAGPGNFKDDCDGFALTMAEMFIERGIKPEHVAICFCAIVDDASPRVKEYHLATKVFNEEDGHWYVVDNNVNYPQRVKNAGGYGWRFEWISKMLASKPGKDNWVEDQ